MLKKYYIILILFGISALVGLDQWLHANWRTERASTLKALAQLYRYRLETGIGIRLNALESLASLFRIHPETGPTEFAQFAENLIHLNPPMRALQYADAETRIIYVFPAETNEIEIHDPITLLSDPVRGAYVRKAIQQKRAVLQGPFELRQGGKGVVVRIPIYAKERFIGLAIGVYDLPALLDETFSQMDPNTILIRLTDGEGRIFFGPETLQKEALDLKLSIADSQWTLSMVWKTLDSDPFAMNHLFILTCGGCFLLFVVILFRQSWKHEKKLERIIGERTQEIAIHKQTEQFLIESETRFRSIFENNHAVMLLIDPETGKIVDANPAAAAFYGYRRNELKAMCITDINVLSKEEIHAEMQRSRNRQCNFFNFRHRLADGTIRVVEVSSGPVDIRGRQLLCSFIQDVTQRRQMEEAMRESERLKGVIETAGAVCHEINQPLQAISGYVELLLLHRKGDPKESEKLKKIQDSVQRLKTITERLMGITQYKTKTYLKERIIDLEESSKEK